VVSAFAAVAWVGELVGGSVGCFSVVGEGGIAVLVAVGAGVLLWQAASNSAVRGRTKGNFLNIMAPILIKMVTVQASGATHLFMQFQSLAGVGCTSNQPGFAAKVRCT